MLRANPDLFDERPQAPKRPLAATTLRQQREHLRLAASVLVQAGEVITSLSGLVRPERFKTVLLTGTMTEACLDILETLFGRPGPFSVLSAVQLRPEPSYWLAACPDEGACGLGAGGTAGGRERGVR